MFTKTIKDYLQKLNSIPKTGIDVVMEDNSMRLRKKYAQVDMFGAEGLYETNVDRWSRNAKHHLGKSEILSADNQPEFEKGDIVLYEGKEVTVNIPLGPNNTVGLIIDNHLKLIHTSKVTKLEEMVMGGLKNVDPINRIMQLAGLDHSGAVVAEEVLNESDAENMLSQMITSAQNLPQYKNNPDAVRMFVYGSVLSQIATDLNTNKFQNATAQSKMQELSNLGALGADLLKTAQTITQQATQQSGTPPVEPQS